MATAKKHLRALSLLFGLFLYLGFPMFWGGFDGDGLVQLCYLITYCFLSAGVFRSPSALYLLASYLCLHLALPAPGGSPMKYLVFFSPLLLLEGYHREVDFRLEDTRSSRYRAVQIFALLLFAGLFVPDSYQKTQAILLLTGFLLGGVYLIWAVGMHLVAVYRADPTPDPSS